VNVVRIYAGLGNQLSQYAFGQAQAENGIDVRYATGWYERRARGIKNGKGEWTDGVFFRWEDSPRYYRLGMFNTEVKIHSFLDKKPVKDTGYNPDLLQMDNNNFLGYWNDFKYYESILPRLRKEFCVQKKYYTDEYLRLKKQITENPSVSVHVRREDYIGRKGFYLLPLSYYMEALRHTEGDIYVFGNGMKWSKEHFKEEYFSRKITFVHLEDYLDFELMKLCDHNITANSSFSRWAAYLNDNPEKIVVSPPGWGIGTGKEMVTIVMTHFRDRQKQLTRTLESFKQYDTKDFNVIIVDDNGSINEAFIFALPYEVKVLKIKNEGWSNPVVALNTGILEALKGSPKSIIIQHSECYHQGNILERAKQMTDEEYISFGCYCLSEGEVPETVIINNKPKVSRKESGWHNHPVHRPVGYNFCSAITTKNLIQLNGFDERFKDGNAYEDNYFLHQVKTLGLKLEITADPFVFHQWHPITNKAKGATNKNHNLYHRLLKLTKNKYRAVHLVTPDYEG